jgi:hypothetical protein
MRSSWQRVFCLTILLLSVQSAWAYIPPSGFILKTWVNRHSSVKLVRVRNTVTAFKDGKPTDVHFKETSFFGPGLASFKSLAQDDSGKKLFVLDKSAPNASVVTKLLLGTDLGDLGRSLKEKGIPIKLEDELLVMLSEEERIKSEVESMGRWKNGLAWVIGQEAQIWFQKDSFQPLRLMVRSEPLDEMIEVQMEDFGGNFSYPRLITLLRKKSGEILLRSQLVDISNVPENVIPMSLFSKQPDVMTSPDLEVGTQGSSERVMELVKTYYNVLR